MLHSKLHCINAFKSEHFFFKIERVYPPRDEKVEVGERLDLCHAGPYSWCRVWGLEFRVEDVGFVGDGVWLESGAGGLALGFWGEGVGR